MFHNPNQNNNDDNADGFVAVTPDSVDYQRQQRNMFNYGNVAPVTPDSFALHNGHQNVNLARDSLSHDQQMEDYISDLFDIKMRLFVDETLEEGVFEMDEDYLSMETDAGEDDGVGSDLHLSGLTQAFFQGNDQDEWSIEGYQMDGLPFPAYDQEEESSNALVKDNGCRRGYSRQWHLSLETIPEE